MASPEPLYGTRPDLPHVRAINHLARFQRSAENRPPEDGMASLIPFATIRAFSAGGEIRAPVNDRFWPLADGQIQVIPMN